jgi:hypothetical protein
MAALVSLLEAPRSPFYRPKGPRSRWTSFGRQYLLSVGWRTGQSGAPPDRYCSLSGAWSPSKAGTADRWSNGRLGSPDTVRCTPDSPVNYSRTPPDFSRERPVYRCSTWRTGHCPVHHRTLSSVPDCAESWLYTAKPFAFLFFSSSFCF